MCKMQTNSHFQTRSERLLIIHIKEYVNRPRHYERGLLEQVVFLHDLCTLGHVKLRWVDSCGYE